MFLAKIKRLYLKLGMHEAPPGSLLYRLHHGLRRSVRSVMPGQRPTGAARAARRHTVAIRISGGIGDHLEAARYIRDLLAYTGDFRFDLYSARPGIVGWIFGGMPQFGDCYDEYYAIAGDGIREYPLSLWIMSFVAVQTEYPDRAAIAALAPKLLEVCDALNAFRPKIALEVKHHPYLDGYLAQKFLLHEFNRHTSSQGTSGIPYGGQRLPVSTDTTALATHGLQGKRYVTIHNGFDKDHHLSGDCVDNQSTKTYPHFSAVVASLRQQFPDLAVVQLGVETSQPIAGVTVNLINKTSLPQTAALIGGALMHIDNESGLVHLAACLGVKSVVVFGATSVEYFGYGDNINIKPDFCGNCWWMSKDWISQCVRGFDRPLCLFKQPPETVAQPAITYLEQVMTAKSAGVRATEQVTGFPVSAERLTNMVKPPKTAA